MVHHSRPKFRFWRTHNSPNILLVTWVLVSINTCDSIPYRIFHFLIKKRCNMQRSRTEWRYRSHNIEQRSFITSTERSPFKFFKSGLRTSITTNYHEPLARNNFGGVGINRLAYFRLIRGIPLHTCSCGSPFTACNALFALFRTYTLLLSVCQTWILREIEKTYW